MIQFNLLPDVKIAYIKTQRTKRLTMLIALVATGASLALVAILFISVQFVQKNNLQNITNDITVQMEKLNKVEDLNKILTIQNQLNSLPELHKDKPVTSRLLPYIIQATPVGNKISKIDADFLLNTLTITGTSDSLATVNKYSDSLKFATYKTPTIQDGKPFNDVVTTSNRTAGGGSANEASYSIVLTFDPVLFANSELPVLTVPKIISTRSETEKPEAIFKEDPTPKPAQGGTR